MATNLKLGDRIAIVKDGVKKGYTPEEAMLQYKINEDGGYNAWKNTFKREIGIDPDKDRTYDYEKFFKENPEAAKLLLEGLVSPEILEMYKTPEARLKEQLIQRQQKLGSINSLMDYSLYEKAINDYMNKSVNVRAYGGRINMFAPGGQADPEPNPEPKSNKIYAGKPSYIIGESFDKSNSGTKNWLTVSTEELESFPKTRVDLSHFDLKHDSSLPAEDLKALKRTTFVAIPALFFRDNNLPVNDDTDSVLYYLPIPQKENERYARKTGKKTKYIHELRKVDIHSKIGRAYIWLKDQLKKWEDYNTDKIYDNPDDPSLFETNFILLDNVTAYGKKSDQLDEDQLEEELNIDLFKPTQTVKTVDVTVPENYKEKIDANPSILAPIGPINMVPKVPNTINVPDHFTISPNPKPEDKERNGLIPDGLDRDVKEKYLNMGLPVGDELHDFNNKPFSTVGSPGGSSLSTGGGGTEIGNGNTDTSTSGGLKMPDIFNFNDNTDYNTEIPLEDFQGDFNYNYEYLEFPNPEYETPTIYELSPSGYVDVPNWNVQQIQDNGDNSGFWNFLAQLIGYSQGSGNNLNDELMSKLFEPKDYFADPYAGNHYGDRIDIQDAFENNPYNKILRESNGIPLYAHGGRINKFDGYSSSFIQTPWYDPWKGNPIGRQVAENNARQQQEFQQSLDEYAKRNNEYINAYKNWDYRNIEGDYPILTNIDLEGNKTTPVYKIPGSVMAKAFPNYVWNDNQTWEPETNYYTIRNDNNLYAVIPNNSYLGQQIDNWKLANNNDSDIPWYKQFTNQINAKFWEFILGGKDGLNVLLEENNPNNLQYIYPQQAQLYQDYKTDYEHLANRKQFEYNNWLADYNKLKKLESTILDKMTTPFLLSKHAGATMKTIEDADNILYTPISDVIATYVKALFDEDNAGMLNTKRGRRFSKSHPYMSMFLNLGMDTILGPKVAKSTIGKPLRYMTDRPKYTELTPDANGNITMYHGSPNSNITEFRIDPTSNSGFTDGVYFTDGRQAAGYKGTFGNGKIYEVEYPYSQRNVVTIDAQGKKWGSIPEQNVADAFGLSVDEVYNIIGDGVNDGLKARTYNANQVAKLGRNQGVDAVHIKNVLDRGRRPFRLDRPLDLFIVYDSKDVIPKKSYNSFREIGKDLKESNRTSNLKTPTIEQQAFTYDPVTGYTYTGFNKPAMFGPSFLQPRGFSIGPVLDTQKPITAIEDNVFSNTPKKSQTNATRPIKSTTPRYTELEIIEGATAAKKQILDYLGSEEHILQIMKSGKSREEATTISNEMRNNVMRTEGPIVKDLSEKNLQGEYASSFGTVDELYNNAPEATIKLMLDEPVTFRPHYTISPYAEDYLESIFHELGGHGANMGYSPENILIINAAHPKLGNKYLEALSQWFPHYLEVYDFNAKLKPVRKPEYTGNLSKKVKKEIEYLEDVDEYSTRARAARMGKDKGYKSGNDFKTKDFKYLEKYFTKESLEKLLNDVWGISVPVTGGILLDNK